MEFIIVFWIVCAVLDYGFSFAFLQREFELIAKEQRYKDMTHCFFWCLGGPLSLVATALTFGFKHGIKFK